MKSEPTQLSDLTTMSATWLQCLGLSRKSAEAVMMAHREEKRKLREALGDCTNAFAVTLMVLDERANGETDPDKRYEFAEKHPEIIRARAAMR